MPGHRQQGFLAEDKVSSPAVQPTHQLADDVGMSGQQLVY